MSYCVLVDDVLIRKGTMTGRISALKQRVALSVISDTKQVLHVVEFEEGVEEKTRKIR